MHVASPLREYTSGASTVVAHGLTPGEILDDLEARHPGLRFRVVDEQERVRRHIKIFVGMELTEELDAPMGDARELHIIAALSGG